MRSIKDGDWYITTPVYVGLYAMHGGNASSQARLQDSTGVDNIIHIRGDSDFCANDGGAGGPGSGPDGVDCQVTFVSKL